MNESRKPNVWLIVCIVFAIIIVVLGAIIIFDSLSKHEQTKKIYGGWQILSGGEEYWVFKENEFWWYKSYNDLSDNYWYGTTQIINGREGVVRAGLNVTELDKMVASGKIKYSDYYTVIATPKKLISNGQDRTSTNLKSDDEWILVWAIVDHGEQGIEGQMINAKTADVSYYLKRNN